MQIIPLYRYVRAEGGVTISLVKPDANHTELCRLVADDGLALTDGNVTTYCVDTDTPDVWAEIPDTEGSRDLYKV